LPKAYDREDSVYAESSLSFCFSFEQQQQADVFACLLLCCDLHLPVIPLDQFPGEIRDARCFREASAIGFAKALSADARIANDVGFTFNADELERQIIAVRACGDIPCLFNVLIDQCFRSDYGTPHCLDKKSASLRWRRCFPL
jgi:hypothetical protein